MLFLGWVPCCGMQWSDLSSDAEQELTLLGERDTGLFLF